MMKSKISYICLSTALLAGIGVAGGFAVKQFIAKNNKVLSNVEESFGNGVLLSSFTTRGVSDGQELVSSPYVHAAYTSNGEKRLNFMVAVNMSYDIESLTITRECEGQYVYTDIDTVYQTVTENGIRYWYDPAEGLVARERTNNYYFAVYSIKVNDGSENKDVTCNIKINDTLTSSSTTGRFSTAFGSNTKAVVIHENGRFEGYEDINGELGFEMACEAITEAGEEGAELVLANDVTLEKYAIGSWHDIDISNITLNMNGKSMTTRRAGGALCGDNFVIKDGKFIATAKDDPKYNYSSYGLYIDDRIDAAVNEPSLIENVTIDGGVMIFNNSVVLKNCSIAAIGGNAIMAEHNTFVSIDGGTYSTEMKIESWARGVICFDKDDGEKDSTVIVNGGTFQMLNTGDNMPVINTQNYGTTTLYGGTYNKDISEFVAAGYQAVKVGDNWVVTAQ